MPEILQTDNIIMWMFVLILTESAKCTIDGCNLDVQSVLCVHEGNDIYGLPQQNVDVTDNNHG